MTCTRADPETWIQLQYTVTPGNSTKEIRIHQGNVWKQDNSRKICEGSQCAYWKKEINLTLPESDEPAEEF